MSTLTLPQALQQAILEQRAETHAWNARAQAHFAQEFPEAIQGKPIPQLATRPDILGPELQFWAIEDDEALEDFLFDDLLNALLLSKALDWQQLPPAYIALMLVVEFERHCQFEGWTAVSNKGADEMQVIIQAYEWVGLQDEARALKAVLEAYVKLGDDQHESFHEILGQAYNSAENTTQDIEDRLPVILSFVRAHPEYFGVPENDPA